MADITLFSENLGQLENGLELTGNRLASINSKKDACITLSDIIAGFLIHTGNSTNEGIYTITDLAVFQELSKSLRLLYGAKPSIIRKSIDLAPLKQAISDANSLGVIENPYNQKIHSIQTASFRGYFQYLRSAYREKRVVGFLEVLEQRAINFYDYLVKKVMPLLSSGWPVNITSLKSMESSLKELERKLISFKRDVVLRTFQYVSMLNAADAQLAKRYGENLQYIDIVTPVHFDYQDFGKLEENISYWEGRIKSIQKLKEDLNSRYLEGRVPKALNLAELDTAMQKISTIYRNLIRRKTAVQVFNRAYETDNQAMMSKAASVLVMAHLSNYVHPVGNNITAYAGVLPAVIGPDRSWSSAANGEGSISPEEYAKRVYSIITEGYRPSNRQVNGKVMGMTSYMNIYFFDKPHMGYGGYICLVSWPCRDYCVFDRGTEGDSWEQYIITKKNIDPRVQTVYIGNPDTIGDHYSNVILNERYGVRRYLQIIISYLEQRGLKAGRDFVLRDI